MKHRDNFNLPIPLPLDPKYTHQYHVLIFKEKGAVEKGGAKTGKRGVSTRLP
jgi:hypothetical protein